MKVSVIEIKGMDRGFDKVDSQLKQGSRKPVMLRKSVQFNLLQMASKKDNLSGITVPGNPFLEHDSH